MHPTGKERIAFYLGKDSQLDIATKWELVVLLSDSNSTVHDANSKYRHMMKPIATKAGGEILSVAIVGENMASMEKLINLFISFCDFKFVRVNDIDEVIDLIITALWSHIVATNHCHGQGILEISGDEIQFFENFTKF
jgi:hypothetical protein